jgi:hypothetical protein
MVVVGLDAVAPAADWVSATPMLVIENRAPAIAGAELRCGVRVAWVRHVTLDLPVSGGLSQSCQL